MSTRTLSGRDAWERVMRGEWRTLIRELGWRGAIAWKWECSTLRYVLTQRPHPLCIIGRHRVRSWTRTEFEDIYSYEVDGRDCERKRCEWAVCDFNGMYESR